MFAEVGANTAAKVSHVNEVDVVDTSIRILPVVDAAERLDLEAGTTVLHHRLQIDEHRHDSFLLAPQSRGEEGGEIETETDKDIIPYLSEAFNASLSEVAEVSSYNVTSTEVATHKAGENPFKRTLSEWSEVTPKMLMSFAETRIRLAGREFRHILVSDSLTFNVLVNGEATNDESINRFISNAFDALDVSEWVLEDLFDEYADLDVVNTVAEMQYRRSDEPMQKHDFGLNAPYALTRIECPEGRLFGHAYALYDNGFEYTLENSSKPDDSAFFPAPRVSDESIEVHDDTEVAEVTRCIFDSFGVAVSETAGEEVFRGSVLRKNADLRGHDFAAELETSESDHVTIFTIGLETEAGDEGLIVVVGEPKALFDALEAVDGDVNTQGE